MYRIRNRRSYFRTKWPWKKFFPPRVDERFCEKCGLIYQNGPMPREVDFCTSGSVEATVFPSGTWKRNELTVTFGRCRASGRQLYLSQFFTVEELDDLLHAAVQARRYLKTIRERQGKGSRNRRPRRVN